MSGYVFVQYQGGANANATVSGQVIRAVSGEVATVYAQQFPFTASPAQAGSATLNVVGTTAQYSFSVTPTLATRYTVEVFANSTATQPLVTSSASTVYVIPNKVDHLEYHCPGGHQCGYTETSIVTVPASALPAQMSESLSTYFAVNYPAAGSTGFGSSPTTLQLGAGSPVVGTYQTNSTEQYQYQVGWTYPENNGGANPSGQNCTVSIEAQDGIGLPGGGNYGCGSPTIPATAVYLG